MKTLVLANQKGGVGKSAICCLLAYHFARLGLRTLVLDLDHQGHATAPLTASGKATVSALTSDRALTDAAAMVEPGDFVLVSAGYQGLLSLESQPDRHNEFARNLRGFLHRMGERFDVCVVDTGPNPDIRVVSALVSADYVLAPIDLGQEAISGIVNLFNAPRVGIATIHARLNPRLQFLGMLPNRVKAVPLHKANLLKVMSSSAYRSKLLARVDKPESGGDFMFLADRMVIQQCQANGQFVADVRGQTAARETWAEVKPVLDRVAEMMGVSK
ncbi:ParA family protein [Azohydromonas aeria]|uniref:ParA family protein n=1 Tax=Azohydromonas aeria TaxID=2590212 RepID=UPI0012FA7A14|nr:ParA family protein [Azohydromonas aeria]